MSEIIMTLQQILLAYHDGAGHHNVVYAEKEIKKLFVELIEDNITPRSHAGEKQDLIQNVQEL